MAFNLTIMDANTTPIPAGLNLVLIGDGVAIAKGTVEEGGIITFKATVDGVQHLAVRIDSDLDDSAPEYGIIS